MNQKLENDVIKTSDSVAYRFRPVSERLETLRSNSRGSDLAWSLVVNYNLRGYEHFETTYPDAWVTEYSNGNYNCFDPVLGWALAFQGIKRWSETGIPDFFGVHQKGAKHGLRYGGIWSRKTGKKRTVLFVGRADREFTSIELEDLANVMSEFFVAVTPNVLTESEIAVLTLHARGDSYVDIAKDLGISESAIKARIASARKKLGCRNTAQLIFHVTNTGLISP